MNETSQTSMLSRRVGLVRAEGQYLAQMIRLLDAVVTRHLSPIETQAVEASSLANPEFAGYLLESGIAPQPWLRKLVAPVTLAAPFHTPGATRGSVLVWPSADMSRFHTGNSSVGEAWVETSSLSRASIEAAVRQAGLLARERSTTPVWAYAGWGEVEDHAVSLAQAELQADLRVVPFEQVRAASLDAAFPQGSVVLALSASALPLARILEAQAWVAWSERGTALAQATGPLGPPQALAFFLDRLGLTREAAVLDDGLREVLRSPAAGRSPTWLDGLVERLRQG